jgi:Rod binding domain-containing protein
MNAILNEITALAPDLADTEKKKQLGAARDFEAILIGQMLHSIREEGSGWLGTGEDDASVTAFGFGEDQLAKALAKGGGLGLSKVIAAGLAAKSASAE